MKSKKTILTFLATILFFSCAPNQSQQEKLIGIWENEDRIIIFNDDSFSIYNKNNVNIVSFLGTYRFADNPKYAIYLKYSAAIDSEGTCFSLDGTEFEGYEECILFNITNSDILETQVIATQTMYKYNRVTKDYIQDN